ncbi:UDP-3-O-acyl-N-acetylglucosamine deacetylase [Pectinatus cerevisiiphilus]|uniref:UDP-3-O-acyl-N-acetylglucosamine deacetylase n=1 Tax=Pectinatus cerevisiiphilus TaxID=86956 RepID=A0A4R3KC59_9FIRM|nr:UDP-3-O-acyl-N-acetylglucosamine deacetylase [Pectinatus cerevisiiphilus]TCS80489.1 UDP-3-O-[3-hydroxymyristoyl] N-acetylglucosamine deacetylase [Pectinatus cerevisiiphilus]
MCYQTTLDRKILCEGIGLHSGKNVSMEILPAPEDTGIVFIRTDLPGAPEIRAVAENVTTTLRATTISSGDVRIFTIEHLLSALHIYSIDNCYVKIDGEEPPVKDGCAAYFFAALQKAGRKRQQKLRKEIIIDKIYRIDDGERFVVALPYDGFRISFTSLNEHPLIGIQYADFMLNESVYAKEIAPARTIAYEKEIEQLRKMGLGLGGTLENVIVYNDSGWLNPLRFPDELVRHKVLDIIGDLRLSGGIVKGHFIAVKSGHQLNTGLAKMIRRHSQQL